MEDETWNLGPETAQCVALYVHVPFCQARCAYCDFNTYAGLEALMRAYVGAVCREIEALGRRWGRLTVPTIYFGGGTPSLLPPACLSALLDVLQFTFHIPSDAEITLEANPGTVNVEGLRRLRGLGVNRLSLGIQSAHDDELRLLGRIHTWAQAVEMVKAARSAGFDNLNLDFIFGLPGQTLAHWQKTLEAASALGPEHLSLYCLSVEQGTPLEKRIASGELPRPEEDVAAEMYVLAEQVLARASFFHYEISNWARMNLEPPNPKLRASGGWPEPETSRAEPTRRRLRAEPQAGGSSQAQDEAWNPTPRMAGEAGGPFVCRHNLTYWRNEPWLGVGAGAHSWVGGRRWANVPHPREYIVALERGDAPVAEVEAIDRRLEMGETMMLGLRLAEGVDDTSFRARFGVELGKAYEEELDHLRELGLLDWDGHRVRLTARGRLLGNRVFVHFV